MKRRATGVDVVTAMHDQLVIMAALVRKRGEVQAALRPFAGEVKRTVAAALARRKREDRRWLSHIHRQLVMWAAMLRARQEVNERVAEAMLPWARAMVLAQIRRLPLSDLRSPNGEKA